MTGAESAVFILQEWCAKRFQNLKYDLEEKADSKEKYSCKLTVGKAIFTSKGGSKTTAMHKAALKALKNFSYNFGDVQKNASLKTSSSDESLERNYVGELHEITQKRLLPPPKFEFSYDEENKHFVCTAHLMQLSMEASGRSKKIAKRNTCKKMLEELKTNDLNSIENSQPGTKNHSQSDSDSSPIKTLKHNIKLSLLQPSHVPAQSYSKMVDDLAQLHKFDVSHANIGELSRDGLYQCLVQLSTQPVSVFHGCGATKDEAHTNALINAIVVLKIMMHHG